MNWQELIFGIVGGLALFLYGVVLISHGLQKALGQKAAKLLEKLTNHPLKGLFVGAGITMVFQSSSLTMVTLIGLVNAALLNLGQAIGVMLGAEIGTTITAQIVAFKIYHFSLPIIAIGFFLTLISKNKYLKYTAQAILGFGILFLGMSFMKAGVKPLQDLPYFKNMILSFNTVPIKGVLAATLFTAVIQSSSATTGLIIAMASEGLITLGAAVPLILGANIGTTITGVLASLNSSKTAKRLSLAQVIFNIISVGVVLLFLSSFIKIIQNTSSNLPRQIAHAHTIFNVVSAAIGLLLVKSLANLVEKIIPGKDIQVKKGAKHLEKLILKNPPMALIQAQKEIIRMAKTVDKMISDFCKLFSKYDKDEFKNILEKEKLVDDLYKEINEYLTALTEKPLSSSDSHKLTTLLHITSDIERVGDHIKNLVYFKRHLVRKNILLSKEGQKEIKCMLKYIQKIFKESIKIIKKEDLEIFQKVKYLEDQIDDLEKEFQKKHIERLKKGICKPEADVVFVNILRNLERIGDHSNNIAHGILFKNHSKDIIDE